MRAPPTAARRVAARAAADQLEAAADRRPAVARRVAARAAADRRPAAADRRPAVARREAEARALPRQTSPSVDAWRRRVARSSTSTTAATRASFRRAAAVDPAARARPATSASARAASTSARASAAQKTRRCAERRARCVRRLLAARRSAFPGCASRIALRVRISAARAACRTRAPRAAETGARPAPFPATASPPATACRAE